MNNLLKNSLMGIFAVMLLTSTLTLGVHNGINTPEIEDTDGKKGSVHPVIQIAEATKQIDNEIESKAHVKKMDYNKEKLESHSLGQNPEIRNDTKETL
ncbi:MAG: hypothetical protein ACXW2E_10615, partial [Nitrososphaeraceae archaeon]